MAEESYISETETVRFPPLILIYKKHIKRNLNFKNLYLKILYFTINCSNLLKSSLKKLIKLNNEKWQFYPAVKAADTVFKRDRSRDVAVRSFQHIQNNDVRAYISRVIPQNDSGSVKISQIIKIKASGAVGKTATDYETFLWTIIVVSQNSLELRYKCIPSIISVNKHHKALFWVDRKDKIKRRKNEGKFRSQVPGKFQNDGEKNSGHNGKNGGTP